MQVPTKSTALALAVAALLALPLWWQLGAAIDADPLAGQPAPQAAVQIAGAVSRPAP